MKTKNIYSYPLKKKDIMNIRGDSPAHKIVTINGETFDLTNAVDFLCSEGTEIKAALNGTVVVVFNEVTKNYNGWEEPSPEVMKVSEQDGNYVVLKHANNEFSIYSHFKKNNIKVKLSDKVKTGDLLGYSGNTGWSIKPHLHFMVFKFTQKPPRMDYESLEIRWKQVQ